MPVSFSTSQPFIEAPMFEYFVTVPGRCTNTQSAVLAMVASKLGSLGSKYPPTGDSRTIPDAMPHQQPRRDRRRVVKRDDDAELRGVIGHRPIDVELALFGQLHRGHGRKEFRDRAGPIDRVRLRRNVPFRIGQPEAFLIDDPLVVDPCHGDAGQHPALQLAFDELFKAVAGIGEVNAVRWCFHRVHGRIE